MTVRKYGRPTGHQTTRETYAGKGQGFQALLNTTHAMYLAQGLATVLEVPTPWKVLGDWRKGPVPIYPVDRKDTGQVDYLGFWAGGGLVIEAKECQEPTRFDFDKRWAHEVEFIRRVIRAGHKAATMLLVAHYPSNQVFHLPGPELLARWDAAFKTAGGRKSIPIRDGVMEGALVVPRSARAPVDYLKILE